MHLLVIMTGNQISLAVCQLAEKQRLFLSNRLRIDQFIAENAMSHQHVTIFKSFMVETFLGFLMPGKVFCCVFNCH